jgi:hypothetical protein
MVSVVSGNQMTLNFEPGITERHKSCLDVVQEGALRHRNPLKTIAADMDMSPSDLSRKLSDNPNDPRKFTLTDLEAYIRATGDMNPIYYLVEKYLADDEIRQRRALGELTKQLPQLMAALKQLGVEVEK